MEEKREKAQETKDVPSWIIAHTSEIGQSHLKADPPIPCQDNHAVLRLEKGWGIAVSCDGAGSAPNSHFGSEFIAREATNLFKEIISENKWIENDALPEEIGWSEVSTKAFKKLRFDLEAFAKAEDYPPQSLACTTIILVFSPFGLLLTHIGDGRAGYLNENDEWHSIMTPHKGEEANQTIFITSNTWLTGNFEMSGAKVPECRVINEPPKAFTLLSDGCENQSFELGSFDEETEVFTPQNNPYRGFYDPVITTLKAMAANGDSEEDINKKWSKFIDSGIPQFEVELDDKTMIVGVLNH
jgi:hypothetical protein